jgi:UDP-N-acetylmuramoyl-tripeptide--D-alanyl-D-alanine ligase
MRFDEQFMKNALPDVSIEYGAVPRDPHFVVDSRSVKKGDIFIALEGEHVDGHAFIADALNRGAAGLVIQENKKKFLDVFDLNQLKNICVVFVRDTLHALTSLARAWRALFSIPIIAVTGSVGKTSTKELIGKIFEENGNECLITVGNQNTAIGVSLNVLRLRKHHEFAVFEVGINMRGEMGQIINILRPTTGVITYIGHSHMEGLGSLSDIASEKRDIFKYFTEENIGVINGDQLLLSQASYPHPVIKFGLKTTNQIQARKVRVANCHTNFVLKIYGDKYPITLKQTNSSFVFNTLAATAIAHLLGVKNEVIVDVIQKPFSVAGRFQERPMLNARGTMIDDSYNANPESMKAALLAFQHIDTSRKKIAILGDMLELGINSPFWHRQLGRFLRKVPSLEHVILVGNMVQWTEKAAPVGLGIERVETWQDAVNLLNTKFQEYDSAVVLVKGSLGIGLGNLVKKFTPAQTGL